MRSARTIDSSATPSDSRAPTSTRDQEPWFLLGSDALGRDVLSRVLVGARLSLGVALLSTVLALLIGALVGAAAGYAGGWVDATLMRVADLVMVLPGIYVVLALRGVLPLVLTTTQVFTALVGVLALVGWPSVARGVRGICARARRGIVARDRAAFTPRDAWISGRAGDGSRARVYHGGGDVVLCGTWICATHTELGRDAAGRRGGAGCVGR